MNTTTTITHPGEHDIKLFRAYWAVWYRSSGTPRPIPRIRQIADELGTVHSSVWKRLDRAVKSGWMERAGEKGERSSFVFTDTGIEACEREGIIITELVHNQRAIAYKGDVTPA